MSRAYFAGLPREGETGEELGQVGVSHRRGMHLFSFGERCEMMLHGSDLIEQTQGIQTIAEILEPRLDLRGNTFRRQQPRSRCRRSEVALNNPGALAMFFRQFKPKFRS